MSILTKLQDLREQEHKPNLQSDDIAELWNYVRQLMDSQQTWVTVTATAPTTPTTQWASAINGVVIFDYI